MLQPVLSLASSGVRLECGTEPGAVSQAQQHVDGQTDGAAALP